VGGHGEGEGRGTMTIRTELPWTNACVGAVEYGVTWKRSRQIASSQAESRYHRFWHRPPQHLRIPPRGCPSLALLLWRIRSGMTTEQDGWRLLSLVSRLTRAEAERDALREYADVIVAQCETYRQLWLEAIEP